MKFQAARRKWYAQQAQRQSTTLRAPARAAAISIAPACFALCPFLLPIFSMAASSSFGNPIIDRARIAAIQISTATWALPGLGG
jgi:hypothetical protein